MDKYLELHRYISKSKDLSLDSVGLWASDIIGGLIWALGVGVEATADQQKYNFKMNPSNKGKFVNTGKDIEQDFLPILRRQHAIFASAGSDAALICHSSTEFVQVCGACAGIPTTLESSVSGSASGSSAFPPSGKATGQPQSALSMSLARSWGSVGYPCKKSSRRRDGAMTLTSKNTGGTLGSCCRCHSETHA